MLESPAAAKRKFAAGWIGPAQPTRDNRRQESITTSAVAFESDVTSRSCSFSLWQYQCYGSTLAASAAAAVPATPVKSSHAVHSASSISLGYASMGVAAESAGAGAPFSLW